MQRNSDGREAIGFSCIARDDRVHHRNFGVALCAVKYRRFSQLGLESVFPCRFEIQGGQKRHHGIRRGLEVFDIIGKQAAGGFVCPFLQGFVHLVGAGFSAERRSVVLLRQCLQRRFVKSDPVFQPERVSEQAGQNGGVRRICLPKGVRRLANGLDIRRAQHVKNLFPCISFTGLGEHCKGKIGVERRTDGIVIFGGQDFFHQRAVIRSRIAVVRECRTNFSHLIVAEFVIIEYFRPGGKDLHDRDPPGYVTQDRNAYDHQEDQGCQHTVESPVLPLRFILRMKVLRFLNTCFVHVRKKLKQIFLFHNS